MEWVEVRAKSTDVAIQAAMDDLGVSDRSAVDVEVIQEPAKGFLGMGGQDAVVKVKLRPKSRNRNRRRRGRADGERDRSRGDSDSRKTTDGKGGRDGRSQGGQRQRDHQQQRPKSGGGDRPEKQREKSKNQARSQQKPAEKLVREEKPVVEINDQAPVVEEFLSGLVEAFGLEGDVAVSVDDEVIIANVTGVQTEAMVGVRGSTIEAIHELAKTVLQRQTQSSARLRLDIAGYAERRRQALHIYANQLIDQVIEEGDEITLEPMSAGDRKVIHDATTDRPGVESFSEGESPQRYVVLAPVKGGSEEE